jgi:Ca-activated chloride channel family protein
MRARIAPLAVVVLCLATLIMPGRAAQSDRGRIEGTVADTSGAVLPGVTVALQGPITMNAVTDGHGAFKFEALLPGRYVLEATLPGFSSLRVEADVQPEQTTLVPMQLRVGALSETIRVTGEAPLVSTQSAARQSDPGGIDRRHTTEAYDRIEENAFKHVSTDPLSTFSVDVDTASYANVRRILREGRLPDPGAVRVEELINYFRLPYTSPKGDAPFAITTQVAECPWNTKHRLALIGIQGRGLPARDPLPRNLVFLIDVSGSMNSPVKLPLVQSAMRLLVRELGQQDRVAIVVYAGASGLALPSTTGRDKSAISRAIAELRPGGSTNGAAGILLAYQVARQHFITGGVNRVVLATDGDFNVGVTSQDGLVRLIERERESGVFLSVLGVGTGNLKDSTMEKLADKGNGNYAYLDSLHEARKVLVRELGGTLTTIAKDVKIQVEFNPRAVDGYRLIGYENRLLADEDFNDDTKDAGEIGAGHSVTALYEIVPRGERTPGRSRDRLKYQREASANSRARADELMTVAVRFKAPDGTRSDRTETVVAGAPRPMTDTLGFASAVAEFGMLLQQSKHSGTASFSSVLERARRYRGDDAEGYRTEFIELVAAAAGLARDATNASER